MATISEFYKKLRDLCEERNMTVNEFIKVLNLSSGSPTAWKNGIVPRNTTLIKIADYFGVTVDFLLGKTEKAPTDVGERSKNIPNSENLIRIAGRDGSYQERRLTDEQVAALKAILDQMPEVPDGL